MQNTEAGSRADARDLKVALARLTRQAEDRIQNRVHDVLCTQPRSFLDGIERIPVALPAAEWRQVATEIAAAFGIHHEATIAKTIERLWAMMRRSHMSVTAAMGTDATLVPPSPDWTTVMMWAVEELFEVRPVDVALPVAELELQLEDAMEECDDDIQGAL